MPAEQHQAGTGKPQADIGPLRTCIGCGRREARSDLIRLVLARTEPNGAENHPQVQIDLAKTLPGRGAWLHPAAQCFQNALRRKAVNRALRQPANLATVQEMLETLEQCATTG